MATKHHENSKAKPKRPIGRWLGNRPKIPWSFLVDAVAYLLQGIANTLVTAPANGMSDDYTPMQNLSFQKIIKTQRELKRKRKR